MGQEEWLAPDDTVRVDAGDIAEAIRGDQYNCAIACAIQRKYPRARRVRVNTGTIAFSIDEQRFVYPTPEAAVETIIQPFDTGRAPEPGLVRLKAGIIKPVIHAEDPDGKIARERERRRLDITARERLAKSRTTAVRVSTSKRGYNRYAPDGGNSNG